MLDLAPALILPERASIEPVREVRPDVRSIEIAFDPGVRHPHQALDPTTGITPASGACRGYRVAAHAATAVRCRSHALAAALAAVTTWNWRRKRFSLSVVALVRALAAHVLAADLELGDAGLDLGDAGLIGILVVVVQVIRKCFPILCP